MLSLKPSKFFHLLLAKYFYCLLNSAKRAKKGHTDSNKALESRMEGRTASTIGKTSATGQTVRYVSRTKNVSVTNEPEDDDIYDYPEPQDDHAYTVADKDDVDANDVNPEPQEYDDDYYLNPDLAPMDDEYEVPINE